jgi:hypothetical protein
MIVRMYRKMYTTLFNAVTEALELMAKAQYIDAEAVLKKAQVETERIFTLWEEQNQ